MNTAEILLTEDGSQTLLSSLYGVKYHSKYGSIKESEVVFIDAGLKNKLDLKEINILEMGFGSGLNALMTAIASDRDQYIKYTTYEKHPIEEALYRQLNYGNVFEHQDLFLKLHDSEWNAFQELCSNFSLRKLHGDILEINDVNEYDVIYYDAFAPDAQPNLWTVEIFSKLYQSLREDGILVTYCAKGQVKRNLKSAGFIIEALPGPPGKREMTRARKLPTNQHS